MNVEKFDYLGDNLENNMDSHPNLQAYKSYETFNNTKERDDYRNLKLKSCDEQVNLVKKEFKGRKINVLELGSGNSKFLINLNLNEILKHGWGVEVSQSRYFFSESWIKDLNFSNIKNVNSDILSFDFDLIENLDLCYCVDLCFQFLEPLLAGSEHLVLEKIYKKLSKKGKIILELDHFSRIIDHLPFTEKVWEEFPENDPWKYSLWDCQYDNNLKILKCDKILISKKNEVDKTSIFLKIYTPEDIKNLLDKVGFKNVRFYKDWNFSELDKSYSEIIIIAEK